MVVRPKTVPRGPSVRNKPDLPLQPKKGAKPRAAGLRKRRVKRVSWSRKRLAWLILEWFGLALFAVLGTMLAVGSSAGSFAGSSFFGNLLPFTIGVAVWVMLAAMLLLGWLKLRRGLDERWPALPGVLATGFSAALIWIMFHDGYTPVFTDLRTLVGGKQQAARTTLAHQVYAAYRRHETVQLEKMIIRAQPFDADIRQAAQAFGVDADILLGVAATESSFMPRTSQDGGQGLFQITAVPKFITQQACQKLDIDQPDLNNPRHNAFIAAATLKHYLAEMKEDLFLGLLAYNIGPRNGGLRFIMQQYGASDFITMQPYLQQLPRDYPIRVLSYALAFKMWQQDGKLLAYQEDDNAVHIQRIGIPGLTLFF